MSTVIVAALLFFCVGFACYRMFHKKGGGCPGGCDSCHGCPHSGQNVK